MMLLLWLFLQALSEALNGHVGKPFVLLNCLMPNELFWNIDGIMKYLRSLSGNNLCPSLPVPIVGPVDPPPPPVMKLYVMSV
jgi:hypothetical protein